MGTLSLSPALAVAGWTEAPAGQQSSCGMMGTKRICCLDPFELFSESTLEVGKPRDAAPRGDTSAQPLGTEGRTGTSEQNSYFCSQHCFPISSFMINHFD